MRLAYYCPGSVGGIADYTHAQAAALSNEGVDVTLLTPGRSGKRKPTFAVEQLLADEARVFPGPRLVRQVRRSALICANIRLLRRAIVEGGFENVLLASYFEYAAPLWCSELTSLAQRGVRFAAILHDPIRDYVAGPRWWHRWSIACGYSFLKHVFVHEMIDPKEAGLPAKVQITVIPHGPYDFPLPSQSRDQMRAQLGVPEGAKLMLSFGHIRDGKNLDLVLKAMVRVPEVWLLVAGMESGGIHRGAQFYQQLATNLGVENRCRWMVGHLKKEDVGSMFEASDLAIMAYSQGFRSASGVLNTAVHFRKHSIASSGPGPLKTQLQKFSLGYWVEPDSVEALAAGLSQWLHSTPEPRWDEYESENSWRRNATIVVDQFLRRE